MNKERFHNALALNLGYDRIFNDRQLSIKIDESTPDPLVTLIYEESHKSVSFAASEESDVVFTRLQTTMEGDVNDQDIKDIFDAVHQAYLESNKNLFMI